MMEKITMNDYIIETPKVGIENIKRNKKLTKDLVNLFLRKEYKNIYIIASGSSFNAAYCAKNFIKEILEIEVNIIPPFTYENYEYKLGKKAFIFAISQSGYSSNVISALKKMKKVNGESIALTGNLKSDIKEYCDYLIDYGVGIETEGYVTKGVVTLCEYLMLFALEVGVLQNKISESKYYKIIKEIETAMLAHEKIYIETKKFFENNKKQLLSMEKVYICGCGSNYGTALEGALKIGETIKIPAIAYEVEEYIHGPNLQLTPNYNVFFIDNMDVSSKRILEIYEATKEVTDGAFIITNNKNFHDNNSIYIPIVTCELISPIYNLVVFQYISWRVTETLGIWKKHPLLKKFKEKVRSKTIIYDDED